MVNFYSFSHLMTRMLHSGSSQDRYTVDWEIITVQGGVCVLWALVYMHDETRNDGIIAQVSEKIHTLALNNLDLLTEQCYITIISCFSTFN